MFEAVPCLPGGVSEVILEFAAERHVLSTMKNGRCFAASYGLASNSTASAVEEWRRHASAPRNVMGTPRLPSGELDLARHDEELDASATSAAALAAVLSAGGGVLAAQIQERLLAGHVVEEEDVPKICDAASFHLRVFASVKDVKEDQVLMEFNAGAPHIYSFRFSQAEDAPAGHWDPVITVSPRGLVLASRRWHREAARFKGTTKARAPHGYICKICAVRASHPNPGRGCWECSGGLVVAASVPSPAPAPPPPPQPANMVAQHQQQGGLEGDLLPHQTRAAAAFCSTVGASPRWLFDYTPGAGKTRIMIEILNTYAEDTSCAKVALFQNTQGLWHFCDELLRWPNAYRAFFSRCCPQKAALAAGTPNLSEAAAQRWPVEQLGDRQRLDIASKMRSVLETAGGCDRSRGRMAPLLLQTFLAASGRFCKVVGGSAEHPVARVSFNLATANVYDGKVLIIDEVHSLILESQRGASGRWRRYRRLVQLLERSALHSPLAAFTGTVFTSSASDGERVDRLVGGQVLAYQERPQGLFPRTLPAGVPDASFGGLLDNGLVQEVQLSQRGAAAYEKLSAKTTDEKQLRRACCTSVPPVCFHAGKGGRRPFVLERPEEACPKLAAIVDTVSHSTLKTLILIPQSAGLKQLLALLSAVGDFKVATLAETGTFNADFRGEEYRVLVASSEKASQSLHFVAVRRLILACVPVSRGALLQQCCRAIRLHSHTALEDNERDVTVTIFAGVIPNGTTIDQEMLSRLRRQCDEMGAAEASWRAKVRDPPSLDLRRSEKDENAGSDGGDEEEDEGEDEGAASGGSEGGEDDEENGNGKGGEDDEENEDGAARGEEDEEEEDGEGHEDGAAGGADVRAFKMPIKWPACSTKDRKDIKKFRAQLKLLRSQRSRARNQAKRESLDEEIKDVLIGAERLWRRLSSTAFQQARSRAVRMERDATAMIAMCESQRKHARELIAGLNMSAR